MAIARITCTCEICGGTFDHRHECYNRRQADEYEAWAADHITVCPECYRKRKMEERAAELASIREEIAGAELPDLTGTEKQVAWAWKLRLEFLENAKKFMTSYVHGESYTEEFKAAVRKLLEIKTESRFWIDTRDDNLLYGKCERSAALMDIVKTMRAQKEAN